MYKDPHMQICKHTGQKTWENKDAGWEKKTREKTKISQVLIKRCASAENPKQEQTIISIFDDLTDEHTDCSAHKTLDNHWLFYNYFGKER